MGWGDEVDWEVGEVAVGGASLDEHLRGGQTIRPKLGLLGRLVILPSLAALVERGLEDSSVLLERRLHQLFPFL